MSNKLIFLVVLVFLSLAGKAQQVSDTVFTVAIDDPVYQSGSGPIVLIDEAHNNFHTANGRFRPFAMVLEKDGYVVRPYANEFSKEQLANGRILVIANALHASNVRNWTLPTPDAFSDAEIEAVNTWVKNGGSLFLIADHMPFPGAAAKLAASFGFRFHNGFARKGGGKDIFTHGDGLTVNVLTNGRNEKERITSLQTFTGQAFEIPTDAQAVVKLNGKYQVLTPRVAWQFDKDTPAISGENLVQGAFMQYGKGRLVVFGEAAMFTAQRQGKNKVGINSASASQNAQFLLNAVHWLDGIL